MPLKDEQTNHTWNLLKASHNYNVQLIGSWKRTTEPLNEPNTLNDVYTLNADGSYSVLRADRTGHMDCLRVRALSVRRDLPYPHDDVSHRLQSGYVVADGHC